MSTPIVFSGIAPHPPILVPEIGGERISEIRDSQRAMREFSRKLVEARPDTIVLISPHSPLDRQYFLARGTWFVSGDFAQFRAPQVRLKFENDLELLRAIAREAETEVVPVREIRHDYPLDHGALVPLYYLHEAGWRGKVVVFAYTLRSNQSHLMFGKVIKTAAASLGRRIALVASGDLSHRLIVGGPYEFEPTAHEFDEQVVTSIRTGNPNDILRIDPDLIDRAGECGYRSIVIALGAVRHDLNDHRVLSYEGPFGVGYMVAVLTAGTPVQQEAEHRSGPPQ